MELAADLPEGWDASPGNSITQDIGDLWLSDAPSLALAVPSVVVPRERNILINPDHPDFTKITVEGPFALNIDPRLK